MRIQRVACFALFMLLATIARPLGAVEAPLPPDLAWVPGDVQMLVIAQPEKRFAEGAEAKDLDKLANAHPVIVTWHLQYLEAAAGMKRNELRRVVIFQAAVGGWVAAVTTHEPYDRQKVQAALAADATARTAGGKEYLAGDEDANSLYFASDRLVLIGLAYDLGPLLANEDRTPAGPALAAALASARDGALVVGHVGSKFLAGLQPQFADGPVEPITKADALQLVATDEAGLTVRITAFANAGETKPLADVLAQIGPLVRQYFQLATQNMPEFMQQQTTDYPNAADAIEPLKSVLAASDSALKNMQVTTDDTRTTATIQIKTEQPAVAASLLFSLMPRAQKEQ